MSHDESLSSNLYADIGAIALAGNTASGDIIDDIMMFQRRLFKRNKWHRKGMMK